jgi:hypothetical protein
VVFFSRFGKYKVLLTERTVTTMKDDAISRSAAVSGISDLLMLELKGERLPTYNEVYRAIYDLPSAQPEIIHCKDCKYNPNPPECGNAACVLFYGMTDQMGFCHHGERRERE